MECSEVRNHLLARRRGALSGESLAPVEAHLAGCEGCRRHDIADEALSAVLERRLPRPRAPDALRSSVEGLWGPPPRARLARLRSAARTAGAMALGAALACLVLWAWRPRVGGETDPMVAEAVNDHLRIVYSQRLEVESSDRHQVKPFFTGRLDFAPDIAFAGDAEFPLEGGAVAYFLDRKAATFVFKRRLHTMSVFVFRAEGLPWPALATEPVGEVRGALRTSRGFHVLLWRKGDLGYGVVSDVDERDVRALASKIALGG